MKLRKNIGITAISFLLISLVSLININAQEPNPTWVGEYFNNTTRTGTPTFTRVDNVLVFDWGMGSPGNGLGENEFSARWTSTVNLSEGTYRFWVRSDDQVRVIVDDRTVINTFSNNVVDELISGDTFLNAGTHTIQVDYREFIDEAFIYFDFTNLNTGVDAPSFATPISPTPAGAWTASYFNNPNLTGNPVAIRGEEQPGDNWGTGSPLPSIQNDQWSARWTANLNLDAGTYQIRTNADDGVRVYVDGVLMIDEWHIAQSQEYVVNRTLSAGTHNFIVEYYESGGLAFLNFDIQPVNPSVDVNTVTVITGRLNVREQPNPVTGDILTRVNQGEIFPALARNPSNTWVKINANGVIGWVNATYVAVGDLLVLPIEVNGTVSTDYIVTARPYTVNIRTGPGTQFRDIANFDRGDTAQVIGRNADATWWQIEYDGIVGWSSARFARIEAGASLSDIPVTS